MTFRYIGPSVGSTVESSEITDGTIATADVADNNVTLAKMEDLTQGSVLIYGASGAPTELTVGNAGEILETQGAAANPQFADNANARVFLPLFDPDTVGQGTWAAAIYDTQWFCANLSNTSHADGDNITFNDITLVRGTYTLRCYCYENTDAGIVDFDIQEEGGSFVEVASQDHYAASAAATFKESTSITVAASGKHNLKLRVDGKNGASSDHAARVSAIELIRTGD